MHLPVTLVRTLTDHSIPFIRQITHSIVLGSLTLSPIRIFFSALSHLNLFANKSANEYSVLWMVDAMTFSSKAALIENARNWIETMQLHIRVHHLCMCLLIYATVFGSNGIRELQLPRVRLRRKAWTEQIPMPPDKAIFTILAYLPNKVTDECEREWQNTECVPRNPFQIDSNQIWCWMK